MDGVAVTDKLSGAQGTDAHHVKQAHQTTQVSAHSWSLGQEQLRKNLAAWEQWDTTAAQRVAAAEPGDHITLVTARDGTASFRIRQEDGRQPWLGFTSVPSIVAATVAGKVDYRRGNLIVKGLGCGAEVAVMLERMPPYQAVFAVEAEPLWVNLALRLRDYTESLRTGRLVLLLGDDVAELLVRFYQQHPGYNPIEQTVMWTWLGDRENHAFGGQVAAAMQTAQDALRHQSLDPAAQTPLERAAELADKLASPQHLRVANFTCVYGLNDCCTSRDVLAALATLGATTDHLVLDRPDVVSYEAHRQRLTQFRPDLLLLVDLTRSDVPPDLTAGLSCLTLVRQITPAILAAAATLGPTDFVLAPRHEQIETLLAAGYPPQQVLHLPLGANTALFEPMDLDQDQQQRYGSDVALVGHRPSTDPEDYQIKLPTHQTLWQALIEEIQRRPGEYTRQAAGRFLRRAQRCGVEVRSDDLRSFLTELIETALGEAVLPDVYGQALRHAGVNLRLWQPPGRFAAPTGPSPGSWSASPLANLAAGTAGEGPAMNHLYNAAKIFVRLSTVGGVDRYLLDGMAAGVFFLVKSHPSDRRKDGLGEMFKLGEEVITFDTPDDLVKKVRHYLDHDDQRHAVATRGRRRVLAQHSYAVRTQAALQMMRQALLPR